MTFSLGVVGAGQFGSQFAHLFNLHPGVSAVYVADGAGITHSNIAEARTDEPLSLYDVRLHVLSAGDAFDLEARRPLPAEALEAK